MRRSGAVLVIVSLSAAVVACSAAEPVQRAGDSIALVATRASDGQMDAEIEGTLVRLGSGCLAVERLEQAYVLQFPAGSVLAEDGESIEVPGAGVVAIGDTIHGGGGYIDIDVPTECDVSDEFAIWQSATP